ncbi:hypothetical protein I553_8657 [Mycobacterium xenopi 4042]|uniref:Uncharacterized protein n=1 Tax=Mycobacterium xenopi 4042 TaxID=1299334 RepID=X8CKG7_MYCXE|nr:hypothetical protein I553_8657 [Mycobacterium xenopi 4042]
MELAGCTDSGSGAELVEARSAGRSVTSGPFHLPAPAMSLASPRRFGSATGNPPA